MPSFFFLLKIKFWDRKGGELVRILVEFNPFLIILVWCTSFSLIIIQEEKHRNHLKHQLIKIKMEVLD